MQAWEASLGVEGSPEQGGWGLRACAGCWDGLPGDETGRQGSGVRCLLYAVGLRAPRRLPQSSDLGPLGRSTELAQVLRDKTVEMWVPQILPSSRRTSMVPGCMVCGARKVAGLPWGTHLGGLSSGRGLSIRGSRSGGWGGGDAGESVIHPTPCLSAGGQEARAVGVYGSHNGYSWTPPRLGSPAGSKAGVGAGTG